MKKIWKTDELPVNNIFENHIFYSLNIYRGDSIFWPDINNQIPDIVCALVKKYLG